MTTKIEIFNRFSVFKALVENHTCRKIKVPIADSIPPMVLILFAEKQEKKGIYGVLQPTVEWGCRKKEQVHSRNC